MPRKRTVGKNYKNAPFENPIIDRYLVKQMKKTDLQERINRQRQKERMMVTLQVNAQTKVMCLPHQEAEIRRKYGL